LPSMPPQVSLVVPCYNESERIRHLLDALYLQTYPRDCMEVVIADGMSTDATREVISTWLNAHPDLSIRVVDNVKRIIPAALNCAIEAARGEIIVRLDGHSAPQPDYVANSVSALENKMAENVGGVWDIRPGDDTWVAQSIAAAAAHPLGVGDALYRHAKQPAYVDTVPFGAFRRDMWERVGRFDETLLTNEDYEFNVRIRKSGGRIWLNPNIRSIYFSRSTFLELARQYWRYGYWKWKMLRRYPDTIRWRQGLPPVFVLTVFIGILFSWIKFVLVLLALELFVYFSILFLAGIQQTIKRKNLVYMFGLPVSIAVMHFSWGSGFLWSMMIGDRLS